jgi:drug/metabolite transporter (DMT)-like permease
MGHAAAMALHKCFKPVAAVLQACMMGPMPHRPASPVLPFCVACAGIALFSLMDSVMKGLSIEIGAYNAMLWRTIIGALLGGALFFARRETMPSRGAFKLHALRSCNGALMAVLFFWGIARVPLAEGIALSFIAPLITLYLAAVLLGETISRNAILASFLGLAGVGVILAGRLGTQAHDADALWGIGAIFISAVLYSYNLILQRQQAQVATPGEVAFFQSLLAACFLSLASPWLAVLPSAEDWLPLGQAALLATCSLFLLSWAYARAEAQILVTVEYTAFIWAALFGWLVFKEPVTLYTLIGTALIVVGCLIATRPSPTEVTAL